MTRTAEAIARSWQQLGVETSLSFIDSTTIRDTVIRPRSFEVLLFGEIIGADPDPYPFWHSSQISSSGFNVSNFNNTEADTVLEEARAIHDTVARGQKYVHFQNILVAEIPAIFLYQPYYPYPLGDTIRGFVPSTIIRPAHRFEQVHKWYIETKRSFSRADD